MSARKELFPHVQGQIFLTRQEALKQEKLAVVADEAPVGCELESFDEVIEEEFGELSFEDMLAGMKDEGIGSFGTGVGHAVIDRQLARELGPIKLKHRKASVAAEEEDGEEGGGEGGEKIAVVEEEEEEVEEDGDEGKKRTRSHGKKKNKKKR